MSYALRSIAFVAELIHAPVQHDPHGLQKLHGALFGSAECSYRDFRLVPGGAQFSNAMGGLPGSPVSCCARTSANGSAKTAPTVTIPANRMTTLMLRHLPIAPISSSTRFAGSIAVRCSS